MNTEHLSDQCLKGRVVLVTGGASGIGLATAKCFAAAGASVAILGHSDDKVDEVARQLSDVGFDILPLAADVSRADELHSALEQLKARYGRLDILFANAGTNGVWAPLDELQPEEWRLTLDTNLTGTFLTVRAALPLLKQRGGSVIVCGSVNGTRVFSNTGATAYACSKAGQAALVKMAALELAKHKIRVNIVLPGAIESPIHNKTKQREIEREKEPAEFPEGKIPLTDGMMGKPEQVGNVVIFLASDAASHVTGAEIFIDGGESLLQG